MFSVKLLVFSFIFVSVSAQTKNPRYFAYEKQREKFAKGRVKFQEIKKELDGILNANQNDSSFMEILIKEHSIVVRTEKVINEADEKKLLFLKKSFDAFSKEAKKDLYIGSFEAFYIEADYLRGVLATVKDKENDLVKAMNQILIYLGNNTQFRYKNAREISGQIKTSSIKSNYNLIMKRLAQIETRGSQPEELGSDELFFLEEK